MINHNMSSYVRFIVPFTFLTPSKKKNIRKRDRTVQNMTDYDPTTKANYFLLYLKNLGPNLADDGTYRANY